MMRDAGLRPAVILLSTSAEATGRRIAALVDGEVHGLAGRVTDPDVPFSDTMDHLRKLFADGRPIIGVCAAGILIRALAPALGDKRTEPPVIAIAEDGSAVVPLLGGHRGANALARRIAEMVSVQPAITTASDVRLGIALDEPPAGWGLANPDGVKQATARMLAGETLTRDTALDWLDALPVAVPGAVPDVSISVNIAEASPGALVYHPKTLIVGVGSDRGCPPEDLDRLVEATLDEAALARAAIACVVSIDRKADEPAVHALAERLGVPARFVAADEIKAVEDRLPNPSEIVRAEVGVAGVAEGAAIVAAGEGGRLIVDKRKSPRATCAIGLAPSPVDPATIGRPRGRLFVVGLGPGSLPWRTPEATEALREATDWVGYGLYLDLAADLGAGKTEHRFALGEEELRVRHALKLAGEGKTVALICSGDPGIYAMATLVYEVLDQGEDVGDGARRADIHIVPGISAVQAAAARAGAPIGHDVCLISLSDLMTPWPAIERRVEAAAQGDFVTAFYNPRSMRRTAQIVRALEILSAERPPDTPVIIAAQLGRPEEALTVVPLREVDPAQVDMLSLVIVGASSTKSFRDGAGRARVYTPRGYQTKREAAE
ncbi:MAG: precorrin-3B C(17)-methyltransferase [Pseudomonadota bacterium]